MSFSLRTNYFRYQKVDEEEKRNQTILIPPNNAIADTVPLTSPLVDHEATHKDCVLPSTDEKIQNKTPTKSEGKKNNESKAVRYRIELMHCDIIKDEIWDARPGLLRD